MHVGEHPNFDPSRTFGFRRSFFFRCQRLFFGFFFSFFFGFFFGRTIATIRWFLSHVFNRIFGIFPTRWNAKIFIFGREIGIFFVLDHMHHAVHRHLVAGVYAGKGISAWLFGRVERHRAAFSWVQK